MQATSDETSVVYRFNYSGTPAFFCIYLDTDRNAGTGYRIGASGAEYLIQNDALYRSSGTGSDWSWVKVGGVAFSRQTGTVRFSAARSDIGNPPAPDLVASVGKPDILAPKMTQTLSTPLPPISNPVATNDATSASYAVTYSGSPAFLRIYLDTDRNAATGFSENGTGADYLLEQDHLYRYAGTAGEWSWSDLGAITFTNSNGAARWTVSTATLGAPSVIVLVAKAGPPNVASAVVTQTLSAPAALCGDHACNGSETCSSCPADCGTCPPSTLTFACGFDTSPTDCGFSEQSVAGGRASLSSTARDGATSVRLHTEPGDSNLYGSGAAERDDLSLSQAATGCYEGVEQWWAHSILFPDDYVVPPAGATWNWGVVFDFHHTGPTGQPNFQIASMPTGLAFQISAGATIVNGPGDPGYHLVPIGPVTKNVWYDFVYHIKWSSSSDGYIQGWLNGAPALDYSGPTLYAGEGCYLKLANYHTPIGQPVSVLHDRIRRATTQAGLD